MSSTDPTTPSPVDEQLVAYLDGELDPQESRAVENLLATDPEARRKLQSLQKSWDALGQLQRAEVGYDFVRTTVSVITQAAATDQLQERQVSARRTWRKRLLNGAALVAAAAGAFFVVGRFTSSPNDELVQDLPVLEHMDELQQIPSMDYLHELRRSGLFAEDTSHAD